MFIFIKEIIRIFKVIVFKTKFMDAETIDDLTSGTKGSSLTKVCQGDLTFIVDGVLVTEVW